MKTYEWQAGSGRNICLTVTEEQADIMPRQGRCDDVVEWLTWQDNISAQVDQWDAKTLASELKEYGAWDDDELSDHESNIKRMVWIAVSDINENREEYEVTE